ncbi:protein brambleberry isoform X2 [Betta splendens]|uniref:Protein brambleberry isoform X2 n=1 Tax=Betta splendens TaxID=158456 RepID=A0A9W2XRD9_BETSP|nr:protein brambleberry isoform X2 [Betta splendens]
MSPRLLLGLGLLLCGWPAVSGLFEWLRRPEAPEAAAAASPPAAAPGRPRKDARFEMATADETFLAEAKHVELSVLDTCHHRVVAELRTNCDSLSEEQLAKLGVLLFNCQAEVEGRRTFACTEDMTIKECTTDMDADTWNAYHIVSNRARSVCYATRQQLFRRRAEQTVNALISTASSQLEAMRDLKEGQLELRDLTAASLHELLEGHGALQAQQGALGRGQEQLEFSLRDNLQRLSEEKALIASGQELVAQLIVGITQRMENVSDLMQVQGSEVQHSHRAIVQDLADVRHQAQDIYEKIDHSMSEFLQYQDRTSQYYSDLMTKLQRMNSTLGVLLHYLDSMQSRVDERLRVIQGYLCWAGHWSMNRFFAWFSRIRGNPAPPAALRHNVEPQKRDPSHRSYPQFSTPQKKEKDGVMEQEELNQHSFISDLGVSLVSPSHKKPVPESGFMPVVGAAARGLTGALLDDNSPRNLGSVFDVVNDSRDFVRDFRSPTPSISNSSLSGRQLCSGITKTGKACKKRAVPGQEFCHVHEGGHSSYVHS